MVLRRACTALAGGMGRAFHFGAEGQREDAPCSGVCWHVRKACTAAPAVKAPCMHHGQHACPVPPFFWAW